MKRALSLATMTLVVLSIPLAAQAAVTEGPCDGQVVIDGITYTPENDSASNAILIPSEEGLTADWEGTTGGPIHNHTGAIYVHIGPGKVEVANWGGENAKDQSKADGTYDIDEGRELLPMDIVGIYEISGVHDGDEASCAGFAMIKFEGNPVTTVPGAAAVGLTVLSGIGLLAAGMARPGRKP